MPTKPAETDDLRTFNTSTTSWSDVQGSATTTGISVSTNSPTDEFAIYNIFTGGRTGVDTFTITRSYFPFDLSDSGLALGAGEAITAATLTLRAKIITGPGGHTTGTAAHDKIYLRGASALAGNTSDFGNVYSSGTTKFASFGSGTASTTEGDVVITLNSDGLSFLTSFMGSGTATIAALGFMDDQDTAPVLEGESDETSVKIKLTFAESSGNEPTLSITVGAAPAGPTTYNNIGDEQIIKTNTIIVNSGLVKF